ncbi:hypothetical protein Pcinc_042880 [Petrolisthes cinctipes]|uniref:Uncharacterized protein n=1 Tax=Petrolisthes cinctipes TaxID=88211 RepID=A0AAE1BGM0_PETCI|nr:hypothetical protein Pcinc_042880 [Petrolisthes cinctipes]
MRRTWRCRQLACIRQSCNLGQRHAVTETIVTVLETIVTIVTASGTIVMESGTFMTGLLSSAASNASIGSLYSICGIRHRPDGTLRHLMACDGDQ